MSEHITETPGGQLHFSATEWETFQEEDMHAGKAVVGLMIGIFTTGLLLYIGVLVSVL